MEAIQYSNSAPNLSQEEIQGSDIPKRLQALIQSDSRDFDTWSSLVADVEKNYADDKGMISSAYDPFLARFPLCHWYWSQYAYHVIQISLNPHKGAEIFEKALNSAMYSLGLWIDYCRFVTAFYEDKLAVSRLFRMGIMFVGKDYLSHALWDLYINHEHSQRNWSSLANIYLQVLRYPTDKLQKYYAIFIKFAAGMEEEIRRRGNNDVEPEGGAQPIGTTFSQREISKVIEDLQNPSDETLRAEAVRKYKCFGDQLYQKACELDDRIKGFEKNIRRRYFDMTPLDDEELNNWHMYLDCVEKQDDFLWALQLYERCLISCANYPEFWMRYVEYLDSKGGRELANSALERATKIFLKGVPEMHLFNATYKERIGDASGARTAFIQFDDKSAAYLTKHVIELANMERRLGNLEEAYDIYEKAIIMAEEKMQWHSCSILFMHLSRLKYTITRSANAARDVLIDGIRRVPNCRLLLEELIKFAMMHQEAMQGKLLDSIIADAISARSKASQSLDSKDREDISVFYLEYVDLCGTVDDVRKARNRHLHLFPHLVRDTITCKRLELGNHVPSGIPKQREESPGALHNLQIEDQPSKTENMVQDQERKQQPDFQVLKQYSETPAEVNLSSNSTKQAGEDESGSMKITSALVDLSCQDALEPNALNRKTVDQLTSNGLLEASQGLSSSTVMPELESIPMICGEQDVTLDISQTDRNSKQNDVTPNSIPPRDSPRKREDYAKVDEHSHDIELMSSFSSANNQEHTLAEKQTHSVVTPSGDCLEKDQIISIPFSRETSEVRRYSEDQQHRHQHMSPLQHSQTVAYPSPVQSSPQHYPQNSVPSKKRVHPEQANSIQKKMLTDETQQVNDTPFQSPETSQRQPSSPSVPYAQMSDASQPMPCSDGNYNSQSQMWQYHYQQQQQFLQQQYQLQLYQSMQLQQQYLWQSQLQPQQHTQDQQPSSLQQNQYTQQQAQVSGLLSSNPYQQQYFQQEQQHYQPTTQQAEQQIHQQEIVADGVHQKGHEQHAAQSYQLMWQQYQQQAYMLQQQQQYLQYTYNQLTGQLPQQQQNQPLAHGEENDEEKEYYQESTSDQDI